MDKFEINHFENIHLGKDAVILTCGPSLTEYTKEKVSEFCKDKIIFCIKESVLEYGNIANYFISNGTRFRNYNLNQTKTINFHQYNGNTKLNLKDYHIILPEDRPFNKNNQLLIKKNFSNYDFKNNIKRPWGPGILYETAFYLCNYMGITNVYTIGWDLIDPKKDTLIKHYFEYSTANLYKESIKWNKENQHKQEMIMVNKNIVSLYDYFKKQNMNIIVVGEKSHVNKYIPRIKI